MAPPFVTVFLLSLFTPCSASDMASMAIEADLSTKTSWKRARATRQALVRAEQENISHEDHAQASMLQESESLPDSVEQAKYLAEAEQLADEQDIMEHALLHDSDAEEDFNDDNDENHLPILTETNSLAGKINFYGRRRKYRRRFPSYSRRRYSYRDSFGCARGIEEYYGGKCYKKCQLFRSQGYNNGAYTWRKAPNICARSGCLNPDEEFFGGKCFKKCSLLDMSLPTRTAADQCADATGKPRRSSAYNKGYGPHGKPIINFALEGATGISPTQCVGFNVNNDNSKWPTDHCPYKPDTR